MENATGALSVIKNDELQVCLHSKDNKIVLAPSSSKDEIQNSSSRP